MTDKHIDDLKQALLNDQLVYDKLRMMAHDSLLAASPKGMFWQASANPPRIVGVEWNEDKMNGNSTVARVCRFTADVHLPECGLELTWDENEPYTLYWAEFKSSKSGKKKYGNSGCDDLDDVEEVLGLEVLEYDDIAEEDDGVTLTAKTILGLAAGP